MLGICGDIPKEFVPAVSKSNVGINMKFYKPVSVKNKLRESLSYKVVSFLNLKLFNLIYAT